MAEEKVRVKVHKVLLESERAELKAKRKRKFLITLLCCALLVVGLVGGYIISGIQRGASIAPFKTNKLDKISSYINSIWLYKDDYEDLQGTMEDKAFYGMTRFEEDPYTTYMSKDEMEEFASNINMNYVGIGAQYTYSNDMGTIIRVFKNSPAEKGGMLPGDIIYKVDDTFTSGLDSDQIKELITGESGTNVRITVLRSGKELELTITRGAIEYTAYGEKRDNYVYLSIMSFGESTDEECIEYLNEFKNEKNIIIDLRDNSGGYQGSVQKVAGLFIGPDKVVLNETDNEGNTKSYKTIGTKYYDNFKNVVVLINENTASAAEVLSICLKEQHPNAKLVGTTTYGKGVVQTSYYLEDGSAIKVTTSYWTSPKGTSINKVGVKPDYEVFLDEILRASVYSLEEENTFELDSVSPYVKVAQMGLKYLDYNVDREDGYFDESLALALKEYKVDNDLEENEILDTITYDAILSSVIREYNTNLKKDLQLQKAIEVLGE